VRILLVFAHAEPASFCGALYKTAREELERAGHELRTSDLYAMGFDPVGDRRDFLAAADPTFFKYQKEQLAASETRGFVPGLAAEQQKLLWCELAIFVFPLWWFGLPAILKGWFDRVLAMGLTYGGGRWFETGPLRGRKAMLVMTAGAWRERYTEGAIFGGIERVLYPVHVGIFNLVGLDVLEPFIAWAPSRIRQEQREEILSEWRRRLAGIAGDVPLRMHTIADHPDPMIVEAGKHKI
jgi:NAD(P)H dehydrogenase (quinone)